MTLRTSISNELWMASQRNIEGLKESIDRIKALGYGVYFRQIGGFCFMAYITFPDSMDVITGGVFTHRYADHDLVCYHLITFFDGKLDSLKYWNEC